MQIMRIGIITLWNTYDNYGGMLQTFALHHYLRSMGYDAFIIRYGKVEPLRHKYISNIKNLIKRTLKNLHLLNDIKEEKYLEENIHRNWIKQRNFDLFRKRNLFMSKKQYETLSDLQKDPPEADIYITGSDQVWAKDIRQEFQQIKYLNFGNKNIKRIAFAASFGHNYFPCIDRELFKSLIDRFDKVSLREKIGVDICNSFGINAVKCADSTLLLPTEEYMSFVTRRKHQNKYVYFYTVNISSIDEIYWNQMLEICNTLKWDAIVTTASGYKPAEELFDRCIYDYATVEEWLSNIYYSEIVVTASFHGIVFSIIFHKTFIYTPLKKELSSGNERITDLLESAGLSERIANTEEDLMRLFTTGIDYTNLNSSNLEKLIDNSKEFLNFINNN